MKKRAIGLFLAFLMTLGLFPVAALASTEADLSGQLEGYITAALDAAKEAAGLTAEDDLLARFTESSTYTDWTALAIGRFGYRDASGYHFLYHDGDGYEDYLAAMKSYVTEKYASGGGKLHRVKATEWHRLIVAVNALGGDPTDFGTYNDAPVDLVNDGTYNHPAPGKQGINGSIWALIALDSKDYPVPEEVVTTRAQFIEDLLSRQLADGAEGNELGGWALSGSASDPDITAMTIQALAPYYTDDTRYTYTNKALGQETTQTVGEAVDAALDRLGELQLSDGDFSSWGTVNVESTAQVLVALCALGIDPAGDTRFIKGSNTLLDGILKFRLSGGGFTHAYGKPDPDNPSADPGQFNAMANDQATYALVAYWRFEKGLSSLYDMASDWEDSGPEPEPEMVNITVAVDADTLGLGYLIRPTQVEVAEGTRASAVLTGLLAENGYTWDSDGTIEGGFYLKGIRPVDQNEATVVPYIVEAMVGDGPDYTGRNDDTLGAGDYHETSGWMYFVNNISADKGPSDWRVSDGEVLRWQFSVYGYGADLNVDNSSWGGSPGLVPGLGDKDELIALVAARRGEKTDAELMKSAAYRDAMAALQDSTASQAVLDRAYAALLNGTSSGGSGNKVPVIPESKDPDDTQPDNAGQEENTKPMEPRIFADVPDGHWAKEAVDFVAAKGLFQGTSDTEFSPALPMSRAMLMTVLARNAGVDTSGGESWYVKGLAWAVEQGISDGTAPDSHITREQLAVMLYRYAGEPETGGGLEGFVDAVAVSTWAGDALRWAVEQGIVTGKEGARLDPQGLATRAEAAAMLYRAAGLL